MCRLAGPESLTGRNTFSGNNQVRSWQKYGQEHECFHRSIVAADAARQVVTTRKMFSGVPWVREHSRLLQSLSNPIIVNDYQLLH
jgi:hypothetical protein